ncbi:MAG: cyclic nucleotide-binding domain-containing protein [Elusimicrobia bacterium]|nr:cyclic nucleotide-binding domain-containing protein [Elusimicrobiota bacterium]
MQYDEKLKRLKALTVLKQIPERQIAALAEFLRPKELEDGAPVFEEGSLGMSLYFVSTGKVRISKKVAGGAAKDLAMLNAGEFFGEAALIEDATRSATASAVGKTLLFELFRGDLSRWVKGNPQQAVQFFAELTNAQSRRLRKTSNELTLHSDLASFLLEPGKAGPEFMSHVLERVVPHLEGVWSAAAFVKDDSGSMKVAAARGDGKLEDLAPIIGAVSGTGWMDDATFQADLTGTAGSFGRLVFRAKAAVGDSPREEIGRTLTVVARLVATALELREK